MKLTILLAGENPDELQPQFGLYHAFVEETFGTTGIPFTYETVRVVDGEPLPAPKTLEAVLVSGSPAGVYDDYEWIGRLRTFIQDAYVEKTPMLGICFGHQIMADALGGEVKKSEKGWGVGRHVYSVKTEAFAQKPHLTGKLGSEVAVIASHQDQVVAKPAEAEVFLASEFTPNAGLIYKNGAAISVQPHPEFTADYSKVLVDRRRGAHYSDAHADKAVESLVHPLHRRDLASALAHYLAESAK